MPEVTGREPKTTTDPAKADAEPQLGEDMFDCGNCGSRPVDFGFAADGTRAYQPGCDCHPGWYG